jgi:hypothetical protein
MAERGKVADLVRWHLERRPLIRAVDVYKLLYQGVFGVSHLMKPEALTYLQEEAKGLNLSDQLNDPLCEDVSMDGSVIRVNLRPYLRRGLSLDGLFDAMKETRLREGKPAAFLVQWNSFVNLVRGKELPFSLLEVERLDRELNRVNPQPRHHSLEYGEAYKPAYRVVRRRTVERIIGA